MILSRAIIYSLIAGSIFTVSAVSTVGISQVILNKTPVADIEEEDEDEDIVPVKQLTHTQQLIINLTSFGNLEANIDLDITYKDYNININGDAFVSMERLGDVEAYANLDINAFNKKIDLELTYKDSYAYINIDERKLKLNTLDLNDVTSLVSELITNDNTESIFPKIDTSSLLVNLGNMTSEEKEDEIIYTCNLIDGFPPVIFRSDYNHQMTGLSLSNLTFVDINLSLEASTKILGKGNNKVTTPIDEDKYIDVKNYFGIADQLKGFIDNPKFNINYQFNAYKDDELLANSNGLLYLDLKDKNEFVIEGKLNFNNKENDYKLGYLSNKAFLNINNNIKAYIDENNISNALEDVNKLIQDETISSLISSLDNVHIPLLDFIKAKDINAIINKYEGINIDNNSISISLSNSLLSSNQSELTLTLNIDETGLRTISISNLVFNEYHYDITLSLEEFTSIPSINLDEYYNASNYLNVISNLDKLFTNKKAGITYNASLTKEENNILDIKGDINLSFENGYQINASSTINYQDESIQDFDINVNDDYLALRLDEDHQYYLTTDGIKNTLFTILEAVIDIDSSIFMDGLENLSIPLIDIISSSSYLSILDYFDDVSFDENNITIYLSNSLFSDNSGSFTINLYFSNNGLEEININDFSYQDYKFDLSLSLTDYEEKELIDITNCQNLESYLPLISKVPGIINQVNKYLKEKEGRININVNYSELNISGYLEAKYENYLSLYLDLNLLDKNNNSYHIVFEKDEENYYLIIDETKLIFTDESISSIFIDILEIINDKESVLYQYIEEMLDFDINLKDLLRCFSIKEIDEDDDNLVVSIDLSLVGFDSNLETEILFNEDNEIKAIHLLGNIINNDLDASLTLKEYQENHVEKYGQYIGGSSISEVTNYYTSLSKENRDALVEQIKSFTDISNLSLGVDYSIRVTRDNKLTFTSNGDIDIKNNAISLKGDLVNKENEEILDSSFLISYLDETVYFNYNDKLKLAYEQTDILDLIEIIKTRLPLNDGVSDVLGSILPDGSTLSSPLFNAIKNEDYLSLISYFKNICRDNNYLTIKLDASILGDYEGELVIAFDTNNKGIRNIKINNLYAFGYVLDFDFYIRDYESYSFNKEGYTNLKYIDNLFDTIVDLIDENKYALALNGSIITTDGTIKLNGSTRFNIEDIVDKGIGKITITDKSNNKHNIVIDVTRNKVGINASEEEKRAALNSSEVLFSYNDNLKGSFNLGSLSDTFTLLGDIASAGNKRIEKYKELLTADFSNSVLHQILNGNIEAILYQNLLEGIYYRNGNYEIEINGNFLKENNNIDVSNLVISLKMNDNHEFIGIKISGKLLDYNLDLSLDLASYSDSYKGLEKDNSYFDFSDMGVLVEYLLNTANKDDFDLSGNLSLPLFKKMNVALSGYVHILEDEEGNEKVFAQATINNIPHIAIVSERTLGWDERTLNIYFTDNEVYLDVICYRDGLTSLTSYNDSKHIKLTLSDFMDNILYYLINFGLGISESTFNGKDYASSSNHEIELSKLLKSYSYDASTPSWALSIDMDELTGLSIFNDLDVVIKGDNNKLMKSIEVETAIVSIIEIKFNAKVNNYNYNASKYSQITNYIAKHINDSFNTNFTGDNK